MEQVLIDIGLSEKETKIYLILLENDSLTAAAISKIAKESRTNTYMLLESLETDGIIEIDETKPVKEFSAAPPTKLRVLLAARQDELKKASNSLSSVLPELNSKYRLSQHKPGVIYREGLEGLKDVLEDQVRSADKEVLLIPSSVADDHKEAFEMLKKATVKRKANGVNTRALMYEGARNWEIMKIWAKQDVKTRFLGKTPYDGEVIMYDETSVFIEYTSDRIIITTLINKTITETMKQLFEQLWAKAKV